MIILFVVLLVFSGFFASSEIALMSVPSHLVETFVKQKRTGATKLQWIKDRTDILLITILIGNNLVNTLIAALATKIALDIARISSFEESLAI
jgi:Mg2+/Co2+ transporter CorB